MTPTTSDADYFGDSSKVPAAIRKELGEKDGEHWDETMFNVFQSSDSRHGYSSCTATKAAVDSS
jgi:hypothetical protein